MTTALTHAHTYPLHRGWRLFAGRPMSTADTSHRHARPPLHLSSPSPQLSPALFPFILQMTNFPLFGVGDFTNPTAEPGGPTAQSEFVPDTVINPHPRFAALTANIRERRGRKVSTPLNMDKPRLDSTGVARHHEVSRVGICATS